MQKLLFKKALTICTLIGIMMSAALAADFNPQPDPPGFGMFGLATGQTARLNVYVDRATGIPPFPWQVTLYFLNGDGRVVTEQTFRVIDGESAFLDYTAPLMPLGLRQRLRPIVIVEPDARGNRPGFRPVLEVINNDTQRTAFVYSGGHNPPGFHNPPAFHNPPSNYDSGIFGITRGQVVRLNAVNTLDIYNPNSIPPDPYRVTLSFYTREGILLAQVTKLLAPGQAASLDVNAFNFVPNQGVRLELRAVVTVEPDANGIVPCVMPTVEGFNLNDGKTLFLLPAV